MKYGINITSLRHWDIAKQLYKEGVIDFVEVLLDNFKNSDPQLFRNYVAEIPHAVHIMFSRYYQESEQYLQNFATTMHGLLAVMQPLYVSDHLAKFKVADINYPCLIELDYTQDKDKIYTKITNWQQLLGEKLYLETFPSDLATGNTQAKFYQAMLNDLENIGVLFDISNMVIAELNNVAKFKDWHPIIADTQHFHVAGYAYASENPKLAVDTHDREIDELTLEVIRNNRDIISKNGKTIVIERDFNISIDSWRKDILAVRAALED